MGTIHIKGLFLRANIGFSEHELGKLQDVLINIRMDYDSSLAEISDDPANALDYKTMTKKIVALVEQSRFNLIEGMCRKVLNMVMENPLVVLAEVEIDKPHALRFADSVSLTISASRHGK